MLDKLKTGTIQATQFVQNHQTISACVVTALITHRITYIRTRNGVFLGIVDAVADIVYDWGHDMGMTEKKLKVVYDFLAEQGLLEELKEFIDAMKS